MVKEKEINLNEEAVSEDAAENGAGLQNCSSVTRLEDGRVLKADDPYSDTELEANNSGDFNEDNWRKEDDIASYYW